jgi:hypothetical protein
MLRLPPPKHLAAAAALAAGLCTPASAHVGDHSHMTFAELANHLTAKPDHALAIAAVAALLGVAGFSAALMRRKAQARARAARFPGKPAT